MVKNLRGGWTEVGGRRKNGVKPGSWKKNGGSWKKTGEARGDEGDRKTSTFFVTEFADCWEARDLYHEFKDLGDIDEVYIPNKRTLRGKRYGFVRFFNVADEKMLETKLDNLFLDGKKIFANIPKFGRGSLARRGGVSRRQGDAEGGLPVILCDRSKFNGKAGSERFNAGATYAEVTKGEASTKCLDFKVDRNQVQRLERCYVGVVRTPGSTYTMQDPFYNEGYFTIKVIPLGANMCILEDVEEGALEAMVVEESAWLDVWFKEVRKWKPDDIDGERITWLKVFGVPSVAWNKEFFGFISDQVGYLIHEDVSTASALRMDVARLKIRTDRPTLIQEGLKVQIKGKVFLLLLVEETFSVGDHTSRKSISEFEIPDESSVEGSEGGIEDKEDEGCDEYVPETNEGAETNGFPAKGLETEEQIRGECLEEVNCQEKPEIAVDKAKGVMVTSQRISLDSGGVGKGKEVKVAALMKGVSTRYHEESNVGKFLKDSLVNMGLVCVGEEGVMQNHIEDMEARDKQGFEKTKAQLSSL
ncbi:uncharacterized protein LOC131658143 [Vicia villosa]|uniref:uncharacterized protein LOC131658143 n=1 Tax=Vicia villosa TaxID=3911 RepID=UPI00273B6451|nr:uncharacterized protein LOC131658143 [Vicia villosa]